MRATGATTRLPRPLSLESGKALAAVDMAYAAYGTLSPARDNVVLVLHGLTADQHAAGPPREAGGRPGWWDAAIGPGKPLDTDRYYIVCPNALGSFGGSTGPRSINPATGRPYGLAFPVVTITDMVASQVALLDELGIDRLHAIVGGCMGGFQVLEWMAAHPARIRRAAVISATARTSAHNIALWSVLRHALMSDPAWNGGDYYDGPAPDAGMGLTAMIGALFWMSRESLEKKFSLAPVSGGAFGYSLDVEFAVEGFLDRLRRNAVTGKLDANSLIYLTRAIDYFDLARTHGGLAGALADFASPLLLVSYESDWRYPAAEMDAIRLALPPGVPVRHETLASPMGHGAFLYEFASLESLLRAFIAGL